MVILQRTVAAVAVELPREPNACEMGEWLPFVCNSKIECGKAFEIVKKWTVGCYICPLEEQQAAAGIWKWCVMAAIVK